MLTNELYEAFHLKELSKQECREGLKKFREDLNTYHNTGDKNLLWSEIYPALLRMCFAATLKMTKGRTSFMPHADIAEEASLNIINRLIKNVHYQMKYPLTVCRYAVFYVVYDPKCKYVSKYEYDELSYDDALKIIDDKVYII